MLATPLTPLGSFSRICAFSACRTPQTTRFSRFTSPRHWHERAWQALPERRCRSSRSTSASSASSASAGARRRRCARRGTSVRVGARSSPMRTNPTRWAVEDPRGVHGIPARLPSTPPSARPSLSAAPAHLDRVFNIADACGPTVLAQRHAQRSTHYHELGSSRRADARQNKLEGARRRDALLDQRVG